MIRLAEHFMRPDPSVIRLYRQVGVTHAVASLPEEPNPCSRDAVRRLCERFNDEGLDVAVIEAAPPMDAARAGDPGGDKEIESVCELIESMGAAGIDAWCWNWMTRLSWIRTSLNLPGRGGALCSVYDHADNEAQGPVPNPVSEAQLWENLEAFLQCVVPVAESAGVKLAMHPDDPPRPLVRGTGRIMCTVENYKRMLALYPSPNNGITMCQGNFTLMTDDLPSVIRELGDKIHFVHFRDVRGDVDHFEETFHDEGRTDMLACMRAYKDIGFEGVMRSDHVPTVEGDSHDTPMYSVIGRLHAIGYAEGLREAAWGRG